MVAKMFKTKDFCEKTISNYKARSGTFIRSKHASPAEFSYSVLAFTVAHFHRRNFDTRQLPRN
jgi:hypothetical protein